MKPRVEHEARPVDEGDTEYLHDAVAAKEPVSESAYSTSSWRPKPPCTARFSRDLDSANEENDDEEDSDKQRATESKEEARPVPRIVKNESPMPKPAAPPLLKPEAEPWRSPPEQDALIDRYLAHDSGLRVERGAHWWVFVLLLLLAVTIGKAALWETLPLTDAEALVASRSDNASSGGVRSSRHGLLVDARRNALAGRRPLWGHESSRFWRGLGPGCSCSFGALPFA